MLSLNGGPDDVNYITDVNRIHHAGGDARRQSCRPGPPAVAVEII